MAAESATLNGLIPPSKHISSVCAITYDVMFRIELAKEGCWLRPASATSPSLHSCRKITSNRKSRGCRPRTHKHSTGIQSGDHGILLYTWGSVDADKLTSIAGSERHRCSQGFGREAKPFAILLAEAIVPSALLAAMVDDFAALFAVPAVDCTASSICWREISMVFLDTLRTIGLTTQRTATGMSRLRAIASSSI